VQLPFTLLAQAKGPLPEAARTLEDVSEAKPPPDIQIPPLLMAQFEPGEQLLGLLVNGAGRQHRPVDPGQQ
jgi:hypothetical protein